MWKYDYGKSQSTTSGSLSVEYVAVLRLLPHMEPAIFGRSRSLDQRSIESAEGLGSIAVA